MGELVLEVGEGDEASENTVGHGGGASENLVHVAGAEELHVEVVGVVLDELDHLDLAEHGLVGLLHVVFVSVSVRASSHF